MNTPLLIVEYFERHAKLTETEKRLLISSFKLIRVKKRQLLIQPGFVAKSRYFVLNGAMKAYVIGGKGQEHTIQLAINEWWISDYNSYIFQQPANMFVMAVEDGELLEISFDDEQKLKSFSRTFDTFFRIISEKSVAFMQRRLISNLTLSAEERYNLFLEKYPVMVNRFPQYVIASYLGMTTEFLSKIRNQKIKQKS